MNASIGVEVGSAIVLGALALAHMRDAPELAAVVQTAVSQPTTIQLVLPIDVVELVKASATVIAAFGGAFATIYSIIAASRAKRAEAAAVANTANLGAIKADVKLLERNTNSMTKTIEQLAEQRGSDRGELKGKRQGEAAAEQLAEGQRQGREVERASVAAANVATEEKR